MSTEEQQHLADTFVSLADTLVDDFDLLDFLGLLAEKASQHLNVAAAGVILSDQRGGWHPTATSHETPELVALFTAQTYAGPCQECVRTGSTVAIPNLADHGQRWPAFAEHATQAGYQAAAAVPMRSHRKIIGSLTLLNTTPDGVDEASLQLGQSLADMATIGLLQQPALHRGDLLAEQLQAVLHHRVVLEQAKGTLAEHGQLPPHTAYVLLRDYARGQGQHLSALARHIATTTNMDALEAILAQPHTPHTSPDA
ncbi:GAF domain-containing protein [Allosaccharopolyspora coralli]|uniref:GAF domain-containing protein n=1 Tax=Allosaccharopolyspora coralli TaxID=2665642 RepID=A0A5Q3Q5S0_9PSEU|nr:GAF and ANTAR domain-containing protein [Allosaccharopolyspora coralli]QGK68733.1 GAF domain-containing protein [Allosaccharopolyspora coralli]QGK69971.1 GAF domain-containing protein [Allosaccharopolyspora coralli]